MDAMQSTFRFFVSIFIFVAFFLLISQLHEDPAMLDLNHKFDDMPIMR